MPEPYVGPLLPEAESPRFIVLGLNPGAADLSFQGRSGVFAGEIKAAGGYSRWAATGPYLRDPWLDVHGRNRYMEDRANFARRWTGDPSTTAENLLIVELYPWHSARVTGAMKPDRALVNEFVWEPLAGLDDRVIFASAGPGWMLRAPCSCRDRPRSTIHGPLAARASVRVGQWAVLDDDVALGLGGAAGRRGRRRLTAGRRALPGLTRCAGMLHPCPRG